MSDIECDDYDTFGIVEDDEQEVVIEFDDEFDVENYFYNKENLNEYFG